MEPYLHFPTALDWIEHVLMIVGAYYFGWRRGRTAFEIRPGERQIIGYDDEGNHDA
jgi:hypothetical protein